MNLSGVRPGPLTGRVTAAALTIGAATGAATIMLIAVYAEVGGTPTGLVLAVAVPVALLVLTVWRIVAESGRAAVAPRRRWLIGTVSATIPLVTAVQLAPRTSAADLSGFTEIPGMALLGAIVGVVALVAVVPLVLLLRVVRPRTGLLFAQLSMTVVAVAGTAVCTYAVTSDIPGAGPAVGLATALSGAVAAVIARPIMSGYDAPVTAAVTRS